MFGSLIFVLWIAWLAGLAVVAVLRHRAVRVERQQRAERQQVREARPRQKVTRPSVSLGYRDQLVAAGIIRPATAPDIASDPTIGSNPATSM